MINFRFSSACLLRLKRYDSALESLNEALDIAPDNAKALYRRGQAFHGKREYEKSLTDLQEAQKLAPNDKAIASEIAAVKGEIQAYKARERKAYSKLFSWVPIIDWLTHFWLSETVT